MERGLNMEEGLLKSIEWSGLGILTLKIEDPVYGYVEVVFDNVRFMKMISSNPATVTKENEVWRLEEIANSPLLNGLDHRSDSNTYWLHESFGEYERNKIMPKAHNLHHIVVLTD